MSSPEHGSTGRRARYTVFLEPLDVLAFRDHRPFDAGAHVLARAVFPAPSVIVGALRSALVEALGGHFAADDFGLKGTKAALVGEKNHGRVPSRSHGISLFGPFLARQDRHGIRPLLPPPADLMAVRKSEGGGEFALLRPWTPNAGSGLTRLRLSGAASPHEVADAALPWTPLEVKKPSGDRWLLTPAGIDKVLRGTGALDLEPELDRVPRDTVYQVEERIGIARSRQTLVAGDSLFYVVQTWRFERRHGLAAEVEVSAEPGTDGSSPADWLETLHGRSVALGGKGHRARVHLYRGGLFDDGMFPSSSGQAMPPRARLWFIQPVRWEEQLRNRLASIRPTCVLDRPALLGGWDLARQRPRPLEHAIPPGAVFYLERPDWETLLPALSAPSYEQGPESLHRPAALVGPWAPFPSNDDTIGQEE